MSEYLLIHPARKNPDSDFRYLCVACWWDSNSRFISCIWYIITYLKADFEFVVTFSTFMCRYNYGTNIQQKYNIQAKSIENVIKRNRA